MVNGLRYSLHSPPLRATLLRGAAYFLFASAWWALLPLVAKTALGGDARIYGMLMTCVGSGAVGGALILPRVRARLGPDGTATAGALAAVLVLALVAVFERPLAAAAAALVFGGSWIFVLATLLVSVQTALPNWVRARGLAVFLSVFFGTMALGSVLWGQVASVAGIRWALLLAAAGMLLGIPLTRRARLGQGEGLDLTPALHWPAPVVTVEDPYDRGPVMVTVEYEIAPADRERFRCLMGELSRARRRMGAVQWGLMEDAAAPGRFVECFFEASWVAHLRHHERVAASDRHLQERIHALHRAGEPPRVRHLLGLGDSEGMGGAGGCGR